MESQEKAEFAFELGRITRRWRARLDERLKHMELTQARWFVLLQLSRAGSATQRELAELVGVEGPTLVRVLDALEERGLLGRHACGADRRVKHVRLTEAATPVIDEIRSIAGELREEALDGIPDAELATAWKVLRAIGENMEKGRGDRSE